MHTIDMSGNLERIRLYVCHVACTPLVYVYAWGSSSCLVHFRACVRACDVVSLRDINYKYLEDRVTPVQQLNRPITAVDRDACSHIWKAELIPHENALLPDQTQFHSTANRRSTLRLKNTICNLLKRSVHISRTRMKKHNNSTQMWLMTIHKHTHSVYIASDVRANEKKKCE